MFLERKQGIKIKSKYKTCKWCYKQYESKDRFLHSKCLSKYNKELRRRKTNIDIVSSRVDKFNSPMHNQNKYLSEAKNMEILLAYYEIGWLKKDPRVQN